MHSCYRGGGELFEFWRMEMRKERAVMQPQRLAQKYSQYWGGRAGSRSWRFPSTKPGKNKTSKQPEPAAPTAQVQLHPASPFEHQHPWQRCSSILHPSSCILYPDPSSCIPLPSQHFDFSSPPGCSSPRRVSCWGWGAACWLKDFPPCTPPTLFLWQDLSIPKRAGLSWTQWHREEAPRKNLPSQLPAAHSCSVSHWVPLGNCFHDLSIDRFLKF